MSDLKDLKDLTKAKAEEERKVLQDKIIERLKSIKRDGIDDLIKYLLERTDYFTAPASTKFHSNFDGGLAFHSNNVVELLIQKNEQYKLGLSLDTIYLTGYLHDLCKCNIYEKTMRLKKDEMTGKWIGYASYEINENVPLGHGEKSVILLQQFVKLTLEECLMIRWHMGAYIPKEDYRDYNKAIEMYKSVLAFTNADAEASHFLEEVREPELYKIEEYNQFVKERAMRNKNKA
ncbi:hypothetical protein [Clostridium sp. SM-530-WT-3G]|uniref:hypothetical protein n=1 Tax=Clostridium sp. SM-530-WT-3G TaxID=2725303 RepID=UPI00145DF41E|nr:hypothetical protein [Clostridium sp. SM-530-WT-3G]NME83724.1 hypothetical protein [Clostridium sp. SM-530-WT-3G]